MVSTRLHRLLPALALLVAACAGPATTSSSTPAAGSPGTAASQAVSVASAAPASNSAPTAAARTGIPYGSSPSPSPIATPATAPSPIVLPTPRPTPPPATRLPATPAPSSVAAKIVDFGFTPAALTVTAGTTVTWTNTGQVDHTVTANKGTFSSGTLSPGASFSFTFKVAGTFAYHCAIHPFMTGTVIVKG